MSDGTARTETALHASTRSSTHPVTDLALARRIERTEAPSNVAFVEARAERDPALGATFLEVGGTFALFDGVGSPLTQTFGLGMFSQPSDDDLGELEAFFQSRGADVHHEVSPLAPPELVGVLGARGYHPVELTTLLWLPLDERTVNPPLAQAPASGLTTRRVEPGDPGEILRWVAVSADGWGETPELAAFVRDHGSLLGMARGVSCFVAELDGAAIAAGALSIHEGVALLAGASTTPAWRGRGAQGALLRARLAHARADGCDIAMMGAAPGSTSQCNAERQGFRVAYTRIKWKLGR